MKYEVTRRFIEKGTGKLIEVGSTYECSESRFKEVQAAGNFLKAVPQQPKKKAEQSEE